MKCKICNNETNNTVYETRDMMYGFKDVFEYFQCSNCKVLQIKNFPTNMSKFYPDDYYSYKKNKNKKTIRNLLIKLRDKYALFGKGFLGKLLNMKNPNEKLQSLELSIKHKNKKVLDIGCGSGSLLHIMCELGMKNLLGIDPFIDKDIQYENGLIIKKMDIFDVKGKWDIIMFHNSFEHLSNPIEILKKVSELLAPNGYCVIRIPTSSSYAWKHYRTNWVQLDAPRHFFLHSIESINLLAEKLDLNLYKTVFNSTLFQFWGSEQISKGILLKDKRSYSENPKISLFSKKDISAFKKHAKKLNKEKQGDQAAFYFKKN